jgi:uncharacterized protein with GYD domain
VRCVTRQLVDLIPKIYDTERIARIIGEDGSSDMVRVNPSQQEPVKKLVNDQGIVIQKVYNLGVGKYDVCVTTGPSYMTKRQESLNAMTELLQGNPQLWAVAGDLFIKNMDWPGAQEMAKRFAKTIDPKLLSDEDESPEMQAAKQQMQAMGQEMEQMHQMLQNVQKSFENRDLEIQEFEAKIKAFDAETKRISAVQAGMTPEQMQDIVIGTIHAMINSGDLRGAQDEMEQEMEGEMPPQAPGMPQNEPMEPQEPMEAPMPSQPPQMTPGA